jgi:phosphatidylglycerophosphate synthase
MSVLTFLLAVAAAVFVARGGYVNTLIGAFLFQWNSILDGVDGELARVRFQHSTLGQWLDTVSDDLSNVIFYAALGIGARGMPWGRELMACGLFAVPVAVITAAIYYTEMARIGSGDLYAIDWGFDKAPPPGLAGKFLIFWRTVLKKDFTILWFLFMAVCGVLPWILPFIAAAQLCVFVAAVLRNRRRRAARGQPS